MFKKLFGRKETPTNAGNKAVLAKVDGIRWVRGYVLQLSNMEGTPSYKLTHQLTIGSEVGNVVIADPSVSPRHCTFVLQEDVVSILDHGSVSGTFINGQEIPRGRYIILEESDLVRVGDLEVKILQSNEAVEEEEELEEESAPAVQEVDNLLHIKEVKESKKSDKVKSSFFSRFQKKKELPKKKNNGAVAISTNSPYAANSLIRVLAVICDLLIAYSLYIIFSPFDEFRIFIDDVPVQIGNLVGMDWKGLVSVLNEEYAFVGEMLNDLYQFFSSTFHFSALFILFIAVRLVTTAFLGVSFSEAALGIRSHGNALWKRLGGMLRVILGTITGPLLIFDVPAVVSRRTFKEFMTFTHTYVPSKFITILGVLLFIPLLVAGTLFSPLFQGLELAEPIAINEKLDMRIKVAPVEGAPLKVMKKEVSQFLNLELNYDSQNTSLIPLFKFSGKKTATNFTPSFVVFQRDLQQSVSVELFKTFDLKELLSIGIKGDYFLQQKFVDLHGFVNSSGLTNSSFKKSNDEKANRAFADEFISFTKVAFELNPLNALDNMQEYTPFLKGLMDYRSSLLALIEYKEFDQIDFIKLGNGYFLRVSYLRQKPFDLIVPLIQGEGKIFKVEFDSKENLIASRNKFYKFNFAEANWFVSHRTQLSGDTLDSLQVIDFFSKLNPTGDNVTADKAQSLYGYYFEKSAEIMRHNNLSETEIWKKSVNDVFVIMEKLKGSIPEEENVDNPRIKLYQNFQDLKNAVDSRNKEFFGVSDSTNI